MQPTTFSHAGARKVWSRFLAYRGWLVTLPSEGIWVFFVPLHDRLD